MDAETKDFHNVNEGTFSVDIQLHLNMSGPYTSRWPSPQLTWGPRVSSPLRYTPFSMAYNVSSPIQAPKAKHLAPSARTLLMALSLTNHPTD